MLGQEPDTICGGADQLQVEVHNLKYIVVKIPRKICLSFSYLMQSKQMP